MPQVLELAHLVNEYGVAQMKVRRGGVEARLDPERSIQFELIDEILLHEDLVNAAANFL